MEKKRKCKFSFRKGEYACLHHTVLPSMTALSGNLVILPEMKLITRHKHKYTCKLIKPEDV